MAFLKLVFKNSKKFKKNIFKLPYYLFLLFNFFVFSIFSFYILNLQTGKIDVFANYNSNSKKTIPAPRGQIYAQDKYGNLYPLATNIPYFKVYFKNFKNLDKENLGKIYQKIKEFFPNLTLEEFLNTGNRVLFLGEVDLEKKNKIQNLGIDSLWVEQSYRRFYPYKEVVSKFIGFVQDSKGVYGLEAYYDDFLSGEDGILLNGKIVKVPEPGSDLLTTIDINVQTKVYELAKKYLEDFKAKGAVVIVLNSKTGEIVSLVEIPSYDNNNFNLVNDYSLFELESLKPYEPGSVIKPFLYALGIEEYKITPETTYEDKGFILVDGHKIYNWDKKSYGTVDMQTALNKSLNLGAIFVEEKIGDDNFLKMLEKIKIEEPTNVDLKEEVGSLKTLRKPFGRKVNFYTASFGQGITITPLRLLVDFNIFANRGFILKPFLVKEIRKSNTQKISGMILAKPFSEETINKMNLMLQKVVEDGFGKRAKMENYYVGGKTGTSLVYNPEIKKYDENKIIHTFVGYFPATDAKFTILTLFKETPTDLIASQTVTRLWKEIAEFLASYYGILPDKY
jgi:cell division protein FtsI/penicillin-binding protein 2